MHPFQDTTIPNALAHETVHPSYPQLRQPLLGIGVVVFRNPGAPLTASHNEATIEDRCTPRRGRHCQVKRTLSSKEHTWTPGTVILQGIKRGCTWMWRKVILGQWWE